MNRRRRKIEFDWNDKYKELSNEIHCPIHIPSILPLFFKNKPYEKIKNLIKRKRVRPLINKNIKTPFSLSSNPFILSNWESKVITTYNKNSKSDTKTTLLKTIKIKIRPNKDQRDVIDNWINTSRYLYNKTVALMRTGYEPVSGCETKSRHVKDLFVPSQSNKQSDVSKELIQLQHQYKTSKTKDPELYNIIKDKKKELKIVEKTINDIIQKWELETPSKIRDQAIESYFDAQKTAKTNLRNKNIKNFTIGFKKKTDPNKCITLEKSLIKIIDDDDDENKGAIQIAPGFLKENKLFRMGKRSLKKYKNLVIKRNCKLVKQKNVYWLLIPTEREVIEPKKIPETYCGIDPGIRTFMTCFGNGVSTEYFSQTNMMDKINSRIDKLKSSKGVKKRYFNKLENRKSNLVKELHCKVINDILKNNDVIFYGDIKSHDIVKGNKNHTLNRNFNDLKFYKFKERLLFKATEKSKLVIMVPEHYTTKTCSFCGNTYEIKSSKVYDCVCCGMKMDRDLNSAKNMLLKGIINISDYIK